MRLRVKPHLSSWSGVYSVLGQFKNLFEELNVKLIRLVAVRDASYLKVKAKDTVAPVLEKVGLNINVQLFHFPHHLSCQVSERIHFAVK